MVRVIDVISDELMIYAMLQTFGIFLFTILYLQVYFFSRNSQHARTHVHARGGSSDKSDGFGVKSAKVQL